jgi:IS5 family transposase
MNAPSSCDRLSFMRFLGLGLSDRVPDARTIWLFREKLTKAGSIGPLFERFDATLRAAGYIAMSGQIVDASLIAAPRQRNTENEKTAIKEGRIPDDWRDEPAKLRQKDRDARWTVKFTKAKPREDGSMPPVDLAIPVFGYQNHISIDRGFGFICKWSATDAAAYEGRRLREGLLDKANTAGGVWADTAYRSQANEEFLAKNGFVSHVHRKKPKGRAMSEAITRANNAQSKIRSKVEHVFAEQKDRMGLFILLTQPIYRSVQLLARHCWRKLMPRPFHPKRDIAAQYAFKKWLFKCCEESQAGRRGRRLRILFA